MIRRPYTTKARLFRDSPTEVDIVWYPALPGAPCLDVPSVVASLDNWVQERELGIYSGYKVGEVPGAPRTYNGERAKPKADGSHRCGTEEEWRDGALYDPSRTFPRRADGLPVCCGGVVMGVSVGGRSESYPTAGAVTVGGDVTAVITGAGSVAIGGDGEVTWPDPSYSATLGGFPPLSTLLYTFGDPVTATHWEDPSGEWVLDSTNPPGTSGDWTLTYSVGPDVWTTSAWDGTGSRVFTHVSGPTAGVMEVAAE